MKQIDQLTACASPTFWVKERCAILRRLYRRMPAAKLCKKLGCTPSAIYHQANRLGLNKIARKHDNRKT